ncbi:Starch-binding associating with outer membrane [Fodinibius roseus]|uniref:Starch-binding associating with outer membrane n=2 Tax=Fodinibius roseus TaxID=1194090 RepID=A0A1M5EYH5_9BACT|nr:Starch-binding associating with outer membrane [Fodinibius roseus]
MTLMNKLNILLLLVLSFTVLFSCQDELNQAPLDAPSDVNFFSNESELEVAINGVYENIWWQSRGIPAWEEIDNTTDIGFLRGSGLQDLATGAHSSETGLFESTWNHFYSGIGRANNLLDKMSRAEDKVSEEFYARIQAEARFLRAYFYHYLIEFYGDVPLITEIPSLEESQIGRSPKSEVVDQIMGDLNFAAENLPANWSGDDEGRATQGAALALKARVALYNEDYGTAAQAAEEVIASGEYSLYPDYEGQFQYEGVRSSGVIFDVPYSQGVETTSIPRRFGPRNLGAWSTNVPSQYMVDSYQASDGEPIDDSSVYDPSNPFENRDPRLDASIVRPQSVFAGYVFETHPDSTETWQIVGTDSIRVSNQDVTNPFATFTGYLWRKYLAEEDFPGNIDASTLNWILIRYAEVLLTYAEAKIENNDIDQSVLDAMNRVRARAYEVDPSATSEYPAVVTMNQTELRREIRYERKVELANEGFRLFDLRRWGIIEEVMTGDLVGRPRGAYSEIESAPEIDEDLGYHPDYGALKDQYRSVLPLGFDPDRDYLWPIPQAELDVNDEIEQNPNY